MLGRSCYLQELCYVIIMPTMTKMLTHTEIRYCLLLIPKDYRRYFPVYSHPITIIDDADGEQLFLRMHRTLSRIDGLTKLYRKHHGSKVAVEINLNEPTTAHLRFEEVAFEHLISWPEALRDYINLTDIHGRSYGNKIGSDGTVLTVVDDMRRKFEMKRHGANQLTRCTSCFRSNKIRLNTKISLWLDPSEMDDGKAVLHLSAKDYES